MGRGVALAGHFGAESVEGMCVGLAPLTSLTEPDDVSVDLSGVRSLSATCSAVLVSALRTAHAAGLCDPLERLSPPIGMDFDGWLDEPALRRLLQHPADGGRSVGNGFGCEPFSSLNGIMGARETLLGSISTQVKLDENARVAVRKLIWDLAQNVLAHADIGGGVAAAKVDVARNMLELAVADRGIGIRESLLRGGEDAGDDASAVLAALRPGVTSEPGIGKGYGLFLAGLTLVANEGSLTVRSGRARVKEPAGSRQAGPLPDFGGTIVTALARLDRPLDSKEVEEALEQPQGVTSHPASAGPGRVGQ